MAKCDSVRGPLLFAAHPRPPLIPSTVKRRKNALANIITKLKYLSKNETYIINRAGKKTIDFFDFRVK